MEHLDSLPLSFEARMLATYLSDNGGSIDIDLEKLTDYSEDLTPLKLHEAFNELYYYGIVEGEIHAKVRAA